ncbi:four-helix bundle copper-binding protein [Halalkalicoccus salilacus]|uniref:four-helix bundle copper-binding protein n=1 Tax=Halalkalicoccus salilacus TaxID=3117459 RepID=UPI00300EE843
MSLTDTVSQIDHLADEERECIENCFEATEACEWCADESADEGEGMAECIRLCRDVADVASLHARFMARDSDYSGDLAAVCADLCEECAEECEQHDHDHCQLCAEVLRECAETCREMAS